MKVFRVLYAAIEKSDLRRDDVARGLVFSAALLCALVLAALAYDVLKARARAIDEAHVHTYMLSALLEERSTRFFDAAAASLEYLGAEAVEQRQNGASWGDVGAGALQNAQTMAPKQIEILDSEGRVVYASDERLLAQDHYAYRHFIDHVAEYAPQGVVLSSAPHSPGVVLSRALYGEQKRFLGVVAVEIDNKALTELFADLGKRDRSAFTLVHADGSLLWRHPRQEGWTAFEAGFANRAKTQASGAYTSVGPGGEKEILGYHRLDAYPMVVAAGVSFGEILASWRHTVWTFAAVYLFLCALIIFFTRRLLRELSQRRDLGELLQRNEQVLLNVQRIASMGSWEYDPATGSLNLSEEAQRILGVTPRTFANTLDAFLQMVVKADRSKLSTHYEKMAEGARAFEAECRVLKPDGTVCTVELHCERQRAGKMTPHLLGSMRDISAEVNAAAKLQTSEQQYRAVFESSPMPMWICEERSSIILAANPAALFKYGYSEEEMLGISIFDLQADKNEIGALYQALHGNHAQWMVSTPCKQRTKSGQILHVEISADVLTFDGKSARLLLANDVSLRVEADERQQEAVELMNEANRRLRLLSAQVLRVQEDERARIARELHDEIGQTLTVIKLTLGAAAQAAGEEERARTLGHAVTLAESGVEQVRRLSLDLHPPQLMQLGLESAVDWLLNREVPENGPAFSLKSNLGECLLERTLAINAFRIVQESLTNVLRYAEARNIEVRLLAENEMLQVVVRDDGKGFDVDAAASRGNRGESLGLLGMRERCEFAGGRLTIRTSKGQGCEVCAELPLQIREAA